MTLSMTAFARLSEKHSWGEVIWEIRSVNHRYLDVNFRLPEDFRAIEMPAREKINARLGRGKVECTLRLNLVNDGSAPLEVNEDLITRILEACHIIDKKLHQPVEINPVDILRWPGVVSDTQQDSQAIVQASLELLDTALEQLIVNRRHEGERLQKLIEQRRDAMQKIVAEERERQPEIHDAQLEKVRVRVQELGDSVDEERFEQALVGLVQKMDVHEELDRLDSHFREIARLFESAEPVGRHLDFIMQELNREANTLGSKSADIRTTQASVEMKVLIEQMREQVQNIE